MPHKRFDRKMAMKNLRWKNLPPVRQDQYGYYRCRLCMSPCPEMERFWCSENCLKTYLMLSNGNYVREMLFKRDRGVCALCGVNGAQMDLALKKFQEDLLHPLLMSIHPMIVTTLRSEGWSNIKSRGGTGGYPDAIEFTS